jgi:hypothetical protein
MDDPMQIVIQTFYDYSTLAIAIMLSIHLVYFVWHLLGKSSLAAIIMTMYAAMWGFEYWRSVVAYLFDIKQCGAETLCADAGRSLVLAGVGYVTVLIIQRKLERRRK